MSGREQVVIGAETAGMLLQFMQRVQLNGAEVDAWQKCNVDLRMALQARADAMHTTEQTNGRYGAPVTDDPEHHAREHDS